MVLQALIGSVDMHSIHFYSTLGQENTKEVQGLEYENNVFGPAVSYRLYIEVVHVYWNDS